MHATISNADRPHGRHASSMIHNSLRTIPALVILCLSVFASTSAAQPLAPVYFEDFLARRFGEGTTWDAQRFCPSETNIVARRVLESYGSMFSASQTVTLPLVCIHEGEHAVINYQKRLTAKQVEMSSPVLLQAAAAESLRAAMDEAAALEMKISPLDGSIAGARTYGDTLMLWNSRVFPALNYWSRRGRLSPADLDELTRLEPARKVSKILEWEQQGIYFSTDRSRSILTSTAPPGTSQHLALLALDVVEYWNPDVRLILNRNGWYQTIIDDAPHFTFLGHPETELPSRGLKLVYKGNYAFWIPNLSPKSN